MRAAALALALAACSDAKPDVGLPGALWYVEDGPPHKLVRIAGGARREWTGDLYPSAQVLPDGRLVAIASRGDGSPEAEQMPVAGGEPQRLTAFHRDDWQPTPSPDGTAIAFTSDREGAPRIFVMAADGTAQRRLTARSSGEESDPAWSPDGRYIAYVVDGAVWTHQIATGAERAVTPPGARDSEPAWSPDGAWLAVTRGGAIWVVRSSDGDAIRVTAGKSVEHLPRWL